MNKIVVRFAFCFQGFLKSCLPPCLPYAFWRELFLLFCLFSLFGENVPFIQIELRIHKSGFYSLHFHTHLRAKIDRPWHITFKDVMHYFYITLIQNYYISITLFWWDFVANANFETNIVLNGRKKLESYFAKR